MTPEIDGAFNLTTTYRVRVRTVAHFYILPNFGYTTVGFDQEIFFRKIFIVTKTLIFFSNIFLFKFSFFQQFSIFYKKNF